MTRKWGNGAGNIRTRKDGRWEGRYTAGYAPSGGKIQPVHAIAECQQLGASRSEDYTTEEEQPLTRNATDKCVVPKVQHQEMKTLRAEDVKACLDTAKSKDPESRSSRNLVSRIWEVELAALR